MKKLRTVLWRLPLLLCILLAVAFIGIRFSGPMLRPDALGVQDGSLLPCPPSPNCVCSCATDELHGVDALPGDLKALRAVIDTLGDATVVEEQPGYLWVEFRTKIMGYIDDVEFFEADGAVQVRSASRLGRSDLGANRARVERLRSML